MPERWDGGAMALRVRGIVAGYGHDPVLHGIDLDAGPGELVSVLGASGSGKTTLLRVVAGLHRPRAGSVHLGADDVTAVCVLAAPEGVRRLESSGLPVRLVTGAIDERLNDSAFIVPGLGDAGDRQFGAV